MENKKKTTRRDFLALTGMAAAGLAMEATPGLKVYPDNHVPGSTGRTVKGVNSPENSSNQPVIPVNENSKKITIQAVNSNFEREPLIRPFAFAGSFHNEKWQLISYLQSTSGIGKVGLNSPGINWSDSRVFREHSEPAGNALMFIMTEYAHNLLKGRSMAQNERRILLPV